MTSPKQLDADIPGDQQKQLMPTPAAEILIECPPGLQYLTQLDQLLIHQQVELLEVFTGIEMKNRYEIKDILGQQLYFAHEESEFFHRICCGRTRGFIMHITDCLNNEVIRVVRPFKCCAGCCWCADKTACSMEVQIESPPGMIIGYVRQTKDCWNPRFDIQDETQTTVLKIRGPVCPCQTICCTSDIDYDVVSEDGSAEIGCIAKQWGGLFREMITKADSFCVQFPLDMNVKTKALLVGATFLIDFMYFERSKND